MNIYIISIYPFPKGLAPTNRIIAYSKSLILNNSKVTVLLPFPTEKYSTNSSSNKIGVKDDIKYKYLSGVHKSRFLVLRGASIISGYRRFIGYFCTLIEIYNNNRKNKIDDIIISTDDIAHLFVFSMIAKVLYIKSVFIFDEFPIPIRHKSKDRISDFKKILFKLVLLNFDAYISISEELRKFYNSIIPKPTFVLPIIVDKYRFEKAKEIIKLKEFNYICYMGNMEIAKDDVTNIILAFSLLHTEYPALQLHLYGNPNQTDKSILMRLISELKVDEKVIIKGKIDSDEVPNILYNAHVLVSSQPDTKRASGGFPTKLGEYLISGVPTLITDVGENSKYLKDQIHVYFVKPGDHIEYSKKMKLILDNYEEAKSVAMYGKEYITNQFSSLYQGSLLCEFLKTNR